MIIKKTDKGLELKIENLLWGKEKSDCYTSVRAVYSEVGGDVGVNVSGIIAGVAGNAGVNVGGIGAAVGGDAGVNVGVTVAEVEGNAGVNVGGIGALVGGDAGVNVGGTVAGVVGNAGVNVGGIGLVGRLENYAIENILPKITKYLPKWIRETSLPAFNFGVYTSTKSIKNSAVIGIINYLKDEGQEDYLALGLLNLVRTSDGKLSFRPLLSGRCTIDGILRHKRYKQQATVPQGAQAQ